MTITTPRLVLRPFRSQDIATFVAYRSDPNVALYQSWTPPFTPQMAKEFIEDLDKSSFGERGHWYQLALERREDGIHIGDCAVMITTSTPPQAEIGFTLAPAHQGNGYIQEAVGSLIQYLLREEGVAQIFALSDARNARSINTLTRLGLVLTETFHDVEYKGEKVTEYLFVLTQQRWQELSAQPQR